MSDVIEASDAWEVRIPIKKLPHYVLIHIVAFRFIPEHSYEVGTPTGEETEAETEILAQGGTVRGEAGM